MFLTSRIKIKGYNISLVDFHSLFKTKLNLIGQRHWKTLSGRPGVVMISLSIRKSLLRIGRERIRVDSRRRDSNHSHIRICRNELSLVNRA